MQKLSRLVQRARKHRQEVERERVCKRTCEKCGVHITLAEPVFVLYIASKIGEDHFGTQHARFWHQHHLTIGELLRIQGEGACDTHTLITV